jgi:hypothetical protein
MQTIDKLLETGFQLISLSCFIFIIIFYFFLLILFVCCLGRGGKMGCQATELWRLWLVWWRTQQPITAGTLPSGWCLFSELCASVW